MVRIDMNERNLAIGRGWGVFSSDGKRIGDVTEVHSHYLLVSKGLILVRDIYLPLGTVERAEDRRVVLGITGDTLRRMDLSRVPPPLPVEESAPLQDPPAARGDGETDGIQDGSEGNLVTSWEGSESWEPDAIPTYEEMPSYSKPQPNGLVEVEPSVNLAYQDCGYGPAVLLVPGWPFDSGIWEPLPSVLAEHHRVVTFDPRGTGGSDRPWDFYSVEGLANDLHRLVVEQSLLDITLVAWSTGALVALLYAQQHGARVTRLVLLDPLVPRWLAGAAGESVPEFPSELDAETQSLWAADVGENRPALHDRLVDRLTNAPLSGPRRQWLWHRLMLGAQHAQQKTWDAIRDFDPRDILPQIAAPVTIIDGAEDRLGGPRLGAYLTGQLPRAQQVVLDGCGHASFLDQRRAIVDAIVDLTGVLRVEPFELGGEEAGPAEASTGEAEAAVSAAEQAES